MPVLQGRGDAGTSGRLVVVLAAGLLALTAASLARLPVLEPIIGLTFLAAVATLHRQLLRWPTIVAGLLLVIMLIPIKRYQIPGDLPFDLEPYRLAVAMVVGAWCVALLIDRRVRLRASGFEAPLMLLVLAALGSIIANSDHITELGVDGKVLKELTFLFSFILVFYVLLSVIRTRSALDGTLAVLVGAGAVIAFFAVIESRLKFNPFDRLDPLPFLEAASMVDVSTRAGQVRAYGPAQHPIALSAALVMLIPLGVYLAWRTRRRRWWVAVSLLALGSLTTMSRTSIVMLVVVGLVFLWLRPQQTKRLWPALIPALVVIQFLLPGTLGGLRASFFPEGGLIADQSRSVGSRGQGRVADFGPTLDQIAQRPLFGEGFGSRVVDGEQPNAQILDNQWLASLLETGYIGGIALLWLCVLAIRRFGRAARAAPGSDGVLFVGAAASVAALAVGMFTFDAFSFIQVTFLFYIVLAIGAAALAADRFPATRTRLAPVPARARALGGPRPASLARQAPGST